MVNKTILTAVVLLPIAFFGCGEDDQQETTVNGMQFGGSSSAGGTAGEGGTAGYGETVSDGGTVGDGGSASDGGAAGDGGMSSDGGTVGDGGTASDGGAAGDGGMSSDGGTVGDGGTASDGGAAGDGGMSSDGSAAGPNCPAQGDRCVAVCTWLADCAVNSGGCPNYTAADEDAQQSVYNRCSIICEESPAIATLSCSHRMCAQTLRLVTGASDDFADACQGSNEGGTAGEGDDVNPAPPPVPFTAQEADALIERTCVACHGVGATYPQYDVMSYSTVYNKVKTDYTGFNRMPKNGPYWSDEQVERLRLLSVE